jgi:hypothetical protein
MKSSIESLHKKSFSLFISDGLSRLYYLDTVRNNDAGKMSFRGNREGLFRLSTILLGIATEKVGNFWHLDHTGDLSECEIATIIGLDEDIGVAPLRPIKWSDTCNRAKVLWDVGENVLSLAMEIAACAEASGCSAGALMDIRYDAEFDHALLLSNKDGLILLASEAMQMAVKAPMGAELSMPDNGDLALSVQLVESPYW